MFAPCLELLTEGADELKAALSSQTLQLKCHIIGIYICFFVSFMWPRPFSLSRVCCEELILDNYHTQLYMIIHTHTHMIDTGRPFLQLELS